MLQAIWYQLKRLWATPDLIDEVRGLIMTSAQNAQNSADQLQEKIGQLGSAVASVATIVTEARTKIAAQAQAIEDLRSGSVNPDTLAAINASVDSSLDQLAKLVAPVVQDPVVDTGNVPVPPETNPETPAPETVPIPADVPDVVTTPSAVDENGTVVAEPGAGDTVGATEPTGAPDEPVSAPESSESDPTTTAPDGGSVVAGEPAEGGSDDPQPSA